MLLNSLIYFPVPISQKETIVLLLPVVNFEDCELVIFLCLFRFVLGNVSELLKKRFKFVFSLRFCPISFKFTPSLSFFKETFLDALPNTPK